MTTTVANQQPRINLANGGSMQSAQNPIPPTAVGGWFRSDLRAEVSGASLNPTHGSGWIVQIQPTSSRDRSFLNPTNGSWWIVQILPKEQAS